MRKFLNSFKYALRGLFVLAKAERNFKIELLFAVFAIALSCVLKLSALEFLFVLLAITLVLLAELFNTAIEKIMDFIHPEKHDAVRDIKDLSAGAVLLAIIFAFIIALFVFVPKLYSALLAFL